MQLIERANALASSGSRNDMVEVLRACFDDGGVAALAAVQTIALCDDYGGLEMEHKVAAAVCLLRWGPRGLEAIRDNALRDPSSSKNRSLCLGLLAGTAAGELDIERVYVKDIDFLTALTHSIDVKVRAAARTMLREYVLSLDEGDAVSAIGVKLLQTWKVGKGSQANELIVALAVRTLATARPVIDQFERLLSSAASDEPALQHFLSRYPQLLDPFAVQTWSQPDLMGALEPDFVLRRRDDSYLVVEIECPAKPIVTGSPQISAECTHAVHQALAYREFMRERLPTMRSYFPNFSAVECLVVVGMEGGLTEAQRRALASANSSHHDLRIVGFDALARRAETILLNVATGGTETIARLRVT